MSTREAVIAAIVAACASTGAVTVRNADAPDEITAQGWIVVRDGEPGEPERLLGGRGPFVFDHRVDVEVYAQSASSRAQLLTAIETALKADTTLGGAASGLVIDLADLETVQDEGTAQDWAALVAVTVNYQQATEL